MDLNWWQSILAFVVVLTVTGWASAMHREAKRTADLLEELVGDLRLRRSGH